MFRQAFLASRARVVSLPLLAVFLTVPLYAQSIVPLTDAISQADNPTTMSGDGSSIFYFRHVFKNPYQPESVAGTLYMRRAGSLVPEILADNIYVDWMLSDRTGSRLVFGVFRVQRREDPLSSWSQIYSFDVARKKLIQVTTIPFVITGGTYASSVRIPPVALAEDAGKIIFSASVGLIGIYTVSWDGGTPAQVGSSPASALTTDPRGETIYYSKEAPASDRRLDLFRIQLPGGNQEQVLAFENSIYSRISRIFAAADNSVVFLYNYSQIFRFTPATGKTEILYSNHRAELAALSPNGRWLLVESRDDLTGENSDESYELFLISADGNVRRQLTRSDGSLILADSFDTGAKLSEDGSSLMLLSYHQLPGPGSVVSTGEQWLYRVDVTQGQPAFQLVDYVASLYNSAPAALSDGRHFVSFSNLTGTAGGQFFVGSTDGRATRQLAQMNLSGLQSWTVSGDGNVLAYVQTDPQHRGKRIFVYRIRDNTLIEVAEMSYFSIPLPEGTVPPPPSPSVLGMSLDEHGENLVFATNARLGLDAYGTGEYLYTTRLVGGTAQPKIVGTGSAPLISKNGQVIVFQSGFEPRKVSSMRPDGSGLQSLGAGVGPKIDAKGEWVVFVRDDQMVLARADGTFQKLLTTVSSGVSYQDVRISANGESIVGLEGKFPYQSRFFVSFDRTGKETGRVLFRELTYVRAWSVSPDGEQIYFSTLGLASVNSFLARTVPFTYRSAGVVSSDDSFGAAALVNTSSEPTDITVTARDRAGSVAAAPVTIRLDPGHHRARLVSEFLGASAHGQNLTLEIESRHKVDSFFLTGSAGLDRMEGTATASTPSTSWLLPLDSSGPTGPGQTRVSLLLANSQTEPASVAIQLPAAGFGRVRRAVVPPQGTIELDMTGDLPVSSAGSNAQLVEVTASVPVGAQLRITTASQSSMTAVTPVEQTLASASLLLPHVIEGDGFHTRVWVANSAVQRTDVEIAFVDPSGVLYPAPSNPTRLHLGIREIAALSLADLSGVGQARVGYLRIRALTPGGRVSALALVFGENSLHSVEAIRSMRRRVRFPHAVQTRDFYTAYAVVNPHEIPVRLSIDVFNSDGTRRSTQTRLVGSGQMVSGLLSDFLDSELAGGYFAIEGDWPLAMLALIGDSRGSAVANLPQY